jgi:hypothetical protein
VAVRNKGTLVRLRRLCGHRFSTRSSVVDAVYPCGANRVLGDSDDNVCRRSGRRCEIRMAACGGNWS